MFKISIFCILLISIQVVAQFEETRFSSIPGDFGRSTTSQKDADSGLFLPQYESIASNINRGITLEDWRKHALSLDRFVLLDTNDDGIISEEELNKDNVMGKVKTQKQLLTSVSKYKTEFPDYTQTLKKIPSNTRPEDTIEICIPVGRSSVDPDDIHTKTYIQLRQGLVKVEKVNLTEYARRKLIEYEDRNSNMALYCLLGLVLLVFGVSFAVLTFVQKNIHPSEM